MNFSLIIRDNAQQDVFDICNYYENEQVGLSKKFLIELLDFLENIQKMPSRYRSFREKFRYAPMKVFPYYIFYEVVDDTIYVEAVYFKRKHPDSMPK